MSSATEESTAITRYLDAVRAELADLRDGERIEMLEDVRAHLLEVAAEEDGPLDTRLGDPAAYAAELRSAAGLPARATAEPSTHRNGLAARVHRSSSARALRAAHTRLRGTALYREARLLLVGLQPAWWIARAYVLTVVLGMLTNGHGWYVSLFPRVAGSRPLGVMAFLVLVVLSVLWARAARASIVLLLLTVVANAWIVMTGANVAQDRLNRQRQSDFYNSSPSPYTQSIVRGPFGNILNIYPYSLDGTPLKNVLLFDQDGRPISGVVMDDYTRQQAATDARDGQLIPNLFPYPEPLRDGRTGTIFGVRPAPSITPPEVMARATPSAPANSAISPTAPATSPTAPAALSASPSVGPSASPSARLLPVPSPTP